MRLRDYQEDGVKLAAEILTERGSVYIADEMGLGKTAQAITISNKFFSRQILVCCPACLRLNWEREFHLFDDEKRPIYIINSGEELRNYIQCGGVVIVSYDLLTTEEASRLLHCWDVIIFDEAHYLKSIKAKRTKFCFQKLWKCTSRRILLSGTPCPNGIIDGFWPFHQCAPEVFPNYYKYGHRYTHAEKNWFSDTWEFKGGRNLSELKEKLMPFFFRRTKKSVLKELPDKIYNYAPIEVPDPDNYKLSPEELERVLAGKVAVNSSAVATQRRGVGLCKITPALSYIKNLLDDSPSIVVYAYHREVCETLAKELGAYLIIGGQVDRERQEIVDRFQTSASSPDCPNILVGQITAAGIGINLTAADTCVFAELDWVPANMAQAIDRLHRIGQEEIVTVHYLIAKDTLDEQIIGTLHQKIRAINELLKEGDPCLKSSIVFCH